MTEAEIIEHWNHYNQSLGVNISLERYKEMLTLNPTVQVVRMTMDLVSKDVYFPQRVKDTIEKSKSRLVNSLTAVPKFEHESLYLKDYGVREWFEVHLYKNGCLIKSGLRHADEETKSPFYYEKSFWGDGFEEQALKDFNEFLKSKLLEYNKT